MCECKKDKVFNENGEIRLICWKKGCNQPLWKREYQIWNKNKPLLCNQCLNHVEMSVNYYLNIENKETNHENRDNYRAIEFEKIMNEVL